MARILLIPTLIMETRATDNLTGYLKDVFARASQAQDETEADELLKQSVVELTEKINVERLLAASRMAGWLAHEINNPLGAISGNAQLLARRLERDIGEGDTLPGYLRYVDGIRNQTERCARITSELLEFTKSRDVDLKSIDVESVISDVADLAAYGQKNCRVTVVEPAMPIPKVQADRELLAKTLFEVILNAVQASPESGEVKIETSSCAAGEGGRALVKITVSDSGEGIPDDAILRVFDPFFSTKEKAKGLGLTTSLAIMRQLGGSLEIAKTGPDGTVFALQLPVRRWRK